MNLNLNRIYRPKLANCDRLTIKSVSRQAYSLKTE